MPPQDLPALVLLICDEELPELHWGCIWNFVLRWLLWRVNKSLYNRKNSTANIRFLFFYWHFWFHVWYILLIKSLLTPVSESSVSLWYLGTPVCGSPIVWFERNWTFFLFCSSSRTLKSVLEPDFYRNVLSKVLCVFCGEFLLKGDLLIVSHEETGGGLLQGLEALALCFLSLHPTGQIILGHAVLSWLLPLAKGYSCLVEDQSKRWSLYNWFSTLWESHIETQKVPAGGGGMALCVE